MVGACVYIRERGERVEDAQSVNRTCTRIPAQGHASSTNPLPPGKIDRTAQGAWELGARAAQPSSFHLPPTPSLSTLLFSLLVSPETLPSLGTEPVLSVCVLVCLPCLLLVLSRYYYYYYYYPYSASPITYPPFFIATITCL